MLIFSPVFLAAASLLYLGFFIARRLSSPLRKIPGPTVASFTALNLRLNEFKANRTRYIHDLHLRYGPVVRVAPNEVSFTSWPALKEIYCSSGSGYDKTEFYDLFTVFGRRTMFTTLNKANHAKRKRVLADRYANSNIMREPSLKGIQERSNKFLQRCTSAGSQAHDIFMGSFLSSSSVWVDPGSNCLENDQDLKMMYQVAADDSLKNRLIEHWMPNVHRLASGIIDLFAKPRDIPLASNYVLHSSKLPNPAAFTLMGRLGERKDDLDIIGAAAECFDHMAAGIDTTGDGLCMLMWELSQPRSLKYQRRLQEELRQNPGAALDQLPFLDAVIWEALRCYPPIPMSLPRYVPQGGREIDGIFIPEGTVVSCQAYSVQRLSHDVFPEPQLFNPDRWLASEGDAERKRLLFAFSNGGRGCVGKHLALAEMKTLLRDVYSRCSTRPHATMTEESMVMSDQLISSRPVGGQCLLHFDPLEEHVL